MNINIKLVVLGQIFTRLVGLGPIFIQANRFMVNIHTKLVGLGQIFTQAIHTKLVGLGQLFKLN